MVSLIFRSLSRVKLLKSKFLDIVASKDKIKATMKFPHAKNLVSIILIIVLALS